MNNRTDALSRAGTANAATVPATGGPLFLRRALAADALASGATALLSIFGGGLLAPLLGLPTALLVGAGVTLVPFVAFVAAIARQANPDRRAVKAIVFVNILWTIASIALVAGPWLQPTALGYAFVIGQALAVFAFAELQMIGLKRSR